jgi:PAS domain S-box-containing protein
MLLGVLGMIGYAPLCFAPDDLWCLEQLLSQAMVTIRDAVLYQTLQQSAACYRFILEQQTDMICRFRPDTTLTFVNDAYCRYFGQPRQALIGQSFLRLIPPQARAAAQDHVASLILQPRTLTYAHEVCLPDGSTAWQEWTDHAIVDAQGQVLEFLSVGRDITERKRIENVLRVSEAFTRAVLSSLQARIAVLDKDGTIVAVNGAWQRFGNEPHAEAHTRLRVGMNYLDAYRCAATLSDTASQALAGIQAVLDGRRGSFELEYPYPTATEPRWFAMTVTPLQDRDGAVVSHAEITQQKQTEQALRRSELVLRAQQAELQALTSKLIGAQEDERRRLARELHDDLSQRLAFLAIETGKWQKQLDTVPATMQEELRMLHEQLVTLATDVHALSHQLHSTILDDLGLVDALRAECTAVTQRDGVTVSFEAVHVPTVLSRDVALCLYRILQEGLRNVVKHAHAERVEVGLRWQEEGLELTIHDSGVGFVPEQIRGKAGLGLASMAERVRLLHGSFALVSHPGHGTTITAQVPLGKEAQ